MDGEAKRKPGCQEKTETRGGEPASGHGARGREVTE